jgi:hypothetical protein
MGSPSWVSEQICSFTYWIGGGVGADLQQSRVQTRLLAIIMEIE